MRLICLDHVLKVLDEEFSSSIGVAGLRSYDCQAVIAVKTDTYVKMKGFLERNFPVLILCSQRD